MTRSATDRKPSGNLAEMEPMALLADGSPDLSHEGGETPMEDVYRSIWQLTEEVLELLRYRSSNEVHKLKRPDLLWLDDLTETQSNTVIAVRQLCEISPEGVTLKRLAETIGVTPAATSVMVDLLVKKKMLKRTRSKSDRRAVLIRIAPETSDLFAISERTLQESFMRLEDTLGPEILLDWRNTLLTASAALRQVVPERRTPSPEPSPPENAGAPADSYPLP